MLLPNPIELVLLLTHNAKSHENNYYGKEGIKRLRQIRCREVVELVNSLLSD